MDAIISLPPPHGGMIAITLDEASMLVRNREIWLGGGGIHYLCSGSSESSVQAYLQIYRNPKVHA